MRGAAAGTLSRPFASRHGVRERAHVGDDEVGGMRGHAERSPRRLMNAVRIPASTVPTAQARSAATCPMAASACTTRTSSTSTDASASARRMHNADVLDLYGRVGFGTPVVVTR